MPQKVAFSAYEKLSEFPFPSFSFSCGMSQIGSFPQCASIVSQIMLSSGYTLGTSISQPLSKHMESWQGNTIWDFIKCPCVWKTPLVESGKYLNIFSVFLNFFYQW